MALRLQAVVLWLFTWPYYWTFLRYNLTPINHLLRSQSNPEKYERCLEWFVEGKRQELVFVGVTSALSAAATIGVFSWQSVTSTIWIARGLWHCTLLLAILSLILSAQQIALLESPRRFIPDGNQPFDAYRSRTDSTLREPEKNGSNNGDIEALTCRGLSTISKYNVIYIWQCPMMLMSWSWVVFLLALTFHVGAPLMPWLIVDGERNIAIMYLVTLTLSGCNFAWCSFWIYRPNSTFGLETVEYRPYGSRYGVRCASAMDSLRALYPFRPMKDIVRRGSPRPKRFKTKRAS